MNTPLKTAGLGLLLASAALVGCNNTETASEAAEQPAVTEAAAPSSEAAVAIVEAGGATAAVALEKSTDASETAFVAVTKAEALTGTVKSINIETREVVLVGENGVELTLIAGEQAKNLDQVSPGDIVNTEHLQQVTIELIEGGKLPASESVVDLAAQAKEGEMPARAEAETVTSIYTVEAIDIEANTFKLKNVEGAINEFTAKDPKNLQRAAIGDAVVVTVTRAFAIQVVKAEKNEG